MFLVCIYACTDWGWPEMEKAFKFPKGRIWILTRCQYSIHPVDGPNSPRGKSYCSCKVENSIKLTTRKGINWEEISLHFLYMNVKRKKKAGENVIRLRWRDSYEKVKLIIREKQGEREQYAWQRSGSRTWHSQDPRRHIFHNFWSVFSPPPKYFLTPPLHSFLPPHRGHGDIWPFGPPNKDFDLRRNSTFFPLVNLHFKKIGGNMGARHPASVTWYAAAWHKTHHY